MTLECQRKEYEKCMEEQVIKQAELIKNAREAKKAKKREGMAKELAEVEREAQEFFKRPYHSTFYNPKFDTPPYPKHGIYY